MCLEPRRTLCVESARLPYSLFLGVLMGLESLDSVIFGVGIYCVWCEEGLRESSALSRDLWRVHDGIVYAG